MAQIQRRKTYTATIGGVRVGSDAPIVVQSMTNTDTADVDGTISQCMALARAGSELVRVTVNNEAAAQPCRRSSTASNKFGVRVPIIGDFHYNGHLLLKKYPDCARALAKYRINPGNVNIGKKHDDNFRTMIEAAIEIRQAGAHRRQLGLARSGAAHAHDGRELQAAPSRRTPATSRMEAIVASALRSAEAAERYGLRHDQIILSAKVSGVQDLIDVYRELAAPLRLSRCISD